MDATDSRGVDWRFHRNDCRIVAGGGLWLWNGHSALVMVVGASLGVTAVVVTVMASLLPLGLARLGADPVLASGPVATLVQDIVSVGIYLMITTVLLPA